MRGVLKDILLKERICSLGSIPFLSEYGPCSEGEETIFDIVAR